MLLLIIFSCLVISSLVGFVYYFQYVIPSSFAKTTPVIVSDHVLFGVQQWRKSSGKSEYLVSEKLCKIANTRLEDIKIDFSHSGFESKRFGNETTIGENLAKGEPLSAWLSSPSHRDNLEADFTHTCIATDGFYTVQIFGYY